DLAQNAGLQVDNGITVNEFLETSFPDVYAASDVANFFSPVFGKHMRLEHYDLAIRQGETAGMNMTGKQKSFTDLPYFFSFMFNLRIEVYGDMSKYDTVITRGLLGENGGFAKFYVDNNVVNAVMLVNKKEDVSQIKQMISSRRKLSDLKILGNESVDFGQIVNQN
ncbi:MAG: oxidoreductase C-terminal domain-containing protein, partial [Nitrosotalea sp.]